jgi:hypothetical protein
MTDSDDLTLLVDVPLTRAEAGVTPGSQHLRVVDLDTGMILEDVAKVDTEAGLAWRWTHGFNGAHEWAGRYKMMCPPEVLERYKETWQQWK